MPKEGLHLPEGCTVGGQRRENEGLTLLEALPNGRASGTLTHVSQAPFSGPWCRVWRPRSTSRSWVSGPTPAHLESLVDVCIVIHHLSFPWFSLGAL